MEREGKRERTGSPPWDRTCFLKVSWVESPRVREEGGGGVVWRGGEAVQVGFGGWEGEGERRPEDLKRRDKENGVSEAICLWCIGSLISLHAADLPGYLSCWYQ